MTKTEAGPVPRNRAGTSLFVAFALTIAVALVYWPSATALDHLWRDTHEETYTHGYLILLLSLWLAFREREQLATAPVAPVPRALLGLVGLSALWLFAYRATIQELHLLVLPLILWTAILAALGWRVARLLAFPIGYLYFAMPIWSDINGLVQSLSAKMTALLIFLTGLPAFMQGNYVQLPGGEIEIAASCSGLHALIVGLALATLYGKIAEVPLRRRWLWIAVMGALSLIVNWVRIFIVITAAVFTEMQSSLVRHHYWLGWWLFAGAFALFLWWTGRNHPNSANDLSVAEPPAPPLVGSAGIGAFTVVSGFVALAALPLASYGLDWIRADASTSISIAWPSVPSGWRADPVEGNEWTPHFVNASVEGRRRFVDANGHAVEVFTVAYLVQTQDGKLLSFWNSLLAGGERLRIVRERIVDSSNGRWRELRVIDATGARSLIWTRYQIGDRVFVEPRLSQLWYGLVALVKPPISSSTALRTACEPDCRAARHRLGAAAKSLPPSIESNPIAAPPRLT